VTLSYKESNGWDLTGLDFCPPPKISSKVQAGNTINDAPARAGGRLLRVFSGEGRMVKILPFLVVNFVPPGEPRKNRSPSKVESAGQEVISRKRMSSGSGTVSAVIWAESCVLERTEATVPRRTAGFKIATPR
jgi:hypothetical protein